MDLGFWPSVLIGFCAQMVDGALGMAYGLISTTFLLSFGATPAQASAMVHTAEVFTTGASGAAHAWRRNVDWKFVAKLAPAGIVGGVGGAFAVSYIDPDIIKPFVTAYLMGMAGWILFLAIRGAKETQPKLNGAIPLGVVGGFLDASGGGGWGPIVTSTLLGRGHAPRRTIGSVNTAEFLVTVAVSASFIFTLGTSHLQDVAGLIVGGVLAAPLAGHLVRILPSRALMFGVGFVLLGVSGWQLYRLLQPDSGLMTFLSGFGS